MAKLPERPFFTEDFSPDGAGIDFLGLRWVNLEILSQHLLPDVNNATEDLGIYCLAAWIPWRFRQLCNDPRQFTLARFTRFRQAVEVAIAYVSRDESPATQQYGRPHRRIGGQQKLSLPSKLDFVHAHRTESTSLYAAPLYGPSLRYLRLVGVAKAEDGSVTQIRSTVDDADTNALVAAVDHALVGAPCSRRIDEFGDRSFAGEELDQLGLHGLHPAFWRQLPKKTKLLFLRKLLPNDGHNARTLTARLLLDTIGRLPDLDVSAARLVWHTGLLGVRKRHRIADPNLELHRNRWRMLMIRQYQRYVLEYFLKGFELGVLAGCRSLEAITEYAMRDVREAWHSGATLEHVILDQAGSICQANDVNSAADAWRETVHGRHQSHIGNALEPEYDGGCAPAVTMLARWWLSSIGMVRQPGNAELAKLGGADRISCQWFVDWLETRMQVPLEILIRDIFEHLVFAQHVRVALSRFDNQGQRLRFVLGDDGIVPTRSMQGKLAENIPAWMQDRLAAFVNLLSDLAVVQIDDDGQLHPGDLASAIAVAG